MDNSLKTGQYLLDVLNDNDDLIEALGEDKIWPLAARENTLYPFVIYNRDVPQITYTKQIVHDNIINITYRVFSTDYDEGLNIANIIRNTLERKTINFENEIKINDIWVQSVFETFAEDAFCQTIVFRMMVE